MRIEPRLFPQDIAMPAVNAFPSNPVRDALKRCRRHFVGAATFSAVANFLYLTPSIYMMQVYERVVPTGGLVTLVAISVVTLFAYAALSSLDWLRGRLLIRAGAQVDADLAGRALHLVMSSPSLSRLDRAEALRNLDTLRQGISSPAAAAFLDIPWAPIYILVAFLLHPALGALTLCSAVLLLVLAWSNERSIRESVKTSGEAASIVYAKQMHISAHASEVRALGMATALTNRQLTERAEVNRLQAETSFSSGSHGSMMKFLRLTLQSAALGLGALLVVEGQLSAGAVFASSLLLSRALQPIEQVVAAWKTILQARSAYAKLGEIFKVEQRHAHTLLPDPTGAVQIERVTMLAPQSDRVALAEVSFSIKAGEIIGLVGHSGAGKSTLLRALVGATAPMRGNIRFDGASSTDWDPEQLARHVGYLPQSFILFPGTVKENIARFRGEDGGDPASLDKAAILAAQGVDAHEMILRLPNGYDTLIGTGGIGLSAGQTQRIAIARALFGDPKFLVLDEPTAHLDPEAQHAFVKTLSRLRVKGTTVLFATHSGDILASADKILVLKDGRVERFAALADSIPTLRPVSHTPEKASR
jgi:PrtD family type I secretion system ABC transporter